MTDSTTPILSDERVDEIGERFEAVRRLVPSTWQMPRTSHFADNHEAWAQLLGHACGDIGALLSDHRAQSAEIERLTSLLAIVREEMGARIVELEDALADCDKGYRSAGDTP